MFLCIQLCFALVTYVAANSIFTNTSHFTYPPLTVDSKFCFYPQAIIKISSTDYDLEGEYRHAVIMLEIKSVMVTKHHIKLFLKEVHIAL